MFPKSFNVSHRPLSTFSIDSQLPPTPSLLILLCINRKNSSLCLLLHTLVSSLLMNRNTNFSLSLSNFYLCDYESLWFHFLTTKKSLLFLSGSSSTFSSSIFLLFLWFPFSFSFLCSSSNLFSSSFLFSSFLFSSPFLSSSFFLFSSSFFFLS